MEYNITNDNLYIDPDGVNCFEGSSDDDRDHCAQNGLSSNKDKSEVLGCDAAFAEAESIVIPDGMKIIANRAFLQCRNLQSVNIPGTVTVIGNGVFRECSLREITIPDSVEWLGSGIFSWCTALESVTLPEDLKVIPEDMFRQCRCLQNITIPDGVREIEDYAFDGCESLRDIVIPDSVVEIGSCSFDRHSGITLRGKKGSEAERYAKENKILFKEWTE